MRRTALPRGRRPRPGRQRWPWLVVAAVALGAIALPGLLADDATDGALATSPAPSAPPTPSAPTEEQADGFAATAREVLSALPVKGNAPATGYDRVAQFGPSWPDVDANGCDTRNDVLQRDLQDLVLDGDCVVVSGTLQGPYTGKAISFVRGVETSRLVQIDHIVALKDAWRTGAQQLTLDRRVSLANDPLNLVAVDGSANAQKGDGNAATWLPSQKGFRCEYVARQISVKAAYGLWVVAPEKEAMERVLRACPDQRAYPSALSPSS